ncbi:MAG: ribokinase [Anaerocolumna sp.]|jgi:ribokinase|nr:ribokinase [Anaerocolumna sp.]
MKILNFGSLNYDYVYSLEHIVSPGETISSVGLEIFTGGKGLNQSIALAKAGVKVYHGGQVGEDGQLLMERCREFGVECSHVNMVDGKSGHAIIQVDQNGQNSIILYGGSNQKIQKEFIHGVLADFGMGDYILLQNEINNISYIIDKAYEKGMNIILNPSPFNHRIMECDLKKISIFLLNEIEGEQLTCESSPENILVKMIEMFPDAKIVLTLGGKGSLYGDKNHTYSQDIYPVKVVDTTAAGDTFTGFFIASLLKNKGVKEALILAAKASAMAVGKKGAVDSIPYYNEVINVK